MFVAERERALPGSDVHNGGVQGAARGSLAPCVSLFYINGIGSTGSRGA